MILTGLDADFAVESPDDLVDELRRVATRYERAVAGATAGAQPTAPPTSTPIP
jgi:hypothetical protein